MKKRVRKRVHGEDYLDQIEAVRLTLEDGSSVQFNFAVELRISRDPERIIIEATRAPARLAFWAYQCERCLSKLRAQERVWDDLRGTAYVQQRRHIDEHTTDMPTEANIQARLDVHPDLKAPKELLDRLRKQYGVLRSLRDALDHRTHVLRRLLAQRQGPADPATTGTH